MKKIIAIIPFLVFALFRAQSLTPTENYLYSRSYLEPVTTENPAAAQIQEVQYFDGLGRPTQGIAIKATPTGKDIAVPALYNTDGKKTKDYLPQPVPSQNGAYIPGIGENSVNAYYGVPNAFSEVLYEKSPLGRTEKSAAPGADWQMSGTHTQKAEYLLNIASEVKKFKTATTWNTSTQINDVSISLATDDAYTTAGYYNANTLKKLVSRDEDSNETHTFTNAEGQNILVRKINKKENGTTENLDTYYVYDGFGNLSFIIPPKAAVSALSATLLDKLCYQYKYDKYNRLVEKKIPGKGWEYTVYDAHNRVVAVQDANMAVQNRWIYTKYDQFGRVAYTGINVGGTRTNEQNLATGFGQNTVKRTASAFFNWDGMDIHYDHTGTYPSFGFVKVLSVNYYDTYPSYSFNPPFPATILGKATLTDNATANPVSTKSLPVMSVVKNIENDNWTKNYIYYDNKGRVIGTHSINHLGGYTKTEAELNFAGAAKQAITRHKRLASDAEKVITETFTYDSQNRLLVHKHKVDNNPEEILAQNTYNELSQLTNKKVGGTSPSAPLQSIDYTYNIRGWLTGINPNEAASLGNKLFAYKIKYNTVEGAETPSSSQTSLKVKPKYNGNIAEVDWKTAYAANEPLRRYGYVYDGVNRLRAGFFQPGTNPYTKEYAEVVDYDLNGNISMINRTGGMVGTVTQVIDDLRYTYDGNQLSYVEETGKGNALSGYPLAAGKGQVIKYDANGNMKDHLDKGFTSMAYNFLNLPSQITNSVQEKSISYIYSADGGKVQMTKGQSGDITDYLGNFQYNTLNGALVSSILANEEGYYDFVNSRYVYQYTDHLGNIRLSYAKNTAGSAVVLEENNYYPFGLKHAGYNTGDTTNNKFKYLYNGKEQQSNGNLDYGWRQYMPDLARWNGMDQFSEKFNFASPYAYVLNNPASFTDPDGRDIERNGENWSLSGSDAGWAMSYMQSGGRLSSLENALASWESGGGSFGSSNTAFWGDFMGINVEIPEVTINVTGNKDTWKFGSNLDFNRFMMYNGVINALKDWNYDVNSRSLGMAIANSKGAQQIAAFEKFLFIGVPVALATAGVGGFAMSGEMTAGAFTGRAALDASIQLGANLTTAESLRDAFNSINFTQTILAGAGVNYLGNSLISASTSISIKNNVESVFTGSISNSKFATQSALGIAGGALGGAIGKSGAFKGAVIGTYMQGTSRFGQSVGVGAATILMHAPQTTIDYGTGILGAGK